MRWWIDVANAPHATLFDPISTELEAGGDEVFVTAWDRGQTMALALERWPEVQPVGISGFRRPILAKATSLWDRSSALMSLLAGMHIDVALGHNSYSQLLAAKRLRIPAITMMDYEHQPANHLAFRLADLVLTPRAIPSAALARYGVGSSRLVQYPGFKEEIALSGFSPDSSCRVQLGVHSHDVVAVVRPAAEGALYHRHGNSLCDGVIDYLVENGARVLLTPRTSEQADRYARRAGLTVLTTPVSGANLLYQADLVIGAGGTMTREAALLGSPTWSIFEGRPAAVDKALAAEGRLEFLTAGTALSSVAVRRHDRPSPWVPRREALDYVIGLLQQHGRQLMLSGSSVMS